MKFATIDQRRDCTGDIFATEYDSAEAAIAAAKRDWGYLTVQERRKRIIAAAESEPDEQGGFNLGAYNVIKEFDDIYCD